MTRNSSKRAFDINVLLTFLGKSPNAVAAECPELIVPESEKKKDEKSDKSKISAVVTRAITEQMLIQFKRSFIEFLVNCT